MAETDNKNRVIVLVDGFNLYHAIHDLDKDPVSKRPTNSKHHLKWLNLWSLSKALVHPTKDELVGGYYFSAYANWIDAGAQSRHRDYVSALKSTGMTAVLGKFKEKPRKCPKCKHGWMGHEEKESDVNLAIYLVELAHRNAFDKAIIFTADTDLAPAIRMVKNAFPTKVLQVAIPQHRLGKSNALVASAHGRIKLMETHFERNLFPEKISLVSGAELSRPAKYLPPAVPAMAQALLAAIANPAQATAITEN